MSEKAEKTAEKAAGRQYRLYSKSKLPASDYVINPYIGCTHGCLYCYACFMGRFAGEKRAWGTYAEPKVFSSMKLPARQEGKTILVGSVTDAYQPAERRRKLMPEILGVLGGCRAHVEILTKSELILRDLELIRQIGDVEVGVSLGIGEEREAALLEPGASGVRERLRALAVLHENGIRTYLFVGPYVPGITDLPFLLEQVKGCVDRVCVESLNLRGSYRTAVFSYLEKWHPELLPLYREIYQKGGGEAYWAGVEREMERLEKESGVPFVSYFYHARLKKR